MQPNSKKYDLKNYFSSKKIFFFGDVFILAVILIACAVSLFFIFNTEDGSEAEIYHKGELIGKYSLSENRKIELNYEGRNVLFISDNKVYMEESDCPSGVCRHFKPISKAGERIVCAPNGIVVVITGKSEVDGITGGVYA